MTQANPLPDTPFWRLYQGRASGLLHWPEVDAFWATLSQTPSGWYVYDLETPPPENPHSPADFSTALKAAQSLVNARRDRSHSGAIYIDNRETPAFIKVFDPSNMGTSCGGAHDMIFPRYIFSKAKPEPRPAPPPAKKGFLGRLNLAK